MQDNVKRLKRVRQVDQPGVPRQRLDCRWACSLVVSLGQDEVTEGAGAGLLVVERGDGIEETESE